MAKKAFYSFHYAPDSWRASQVRNVGAVEGNQPVSDNEWESITGKGDAAIRAWINGQMSGRSCAVILVGQATAGRKWINYEIQKAWEDGKGVVGVYIHNLKNASGSQAAEGRNPFDGLSVNGTKLSSIVKAYNPPYTTSTYVYDHIKSNIESWVDEAITIRKKH
ncbi:MAG: TIR domain-containing protein [Actinomycetota bacterium]|nr:TIR domain-containing protein [Actinomycetota bacterium]